MNEYFVETLHILWLSCFSSVIKNRLLELQDMTIKMASYYNSYFVKMQGFHKTPTNQKKGEAECWDTNKELEPHFFIVTVYIVFLFVWFR